MRYSAVLLGFLLVIAACTITDGDRISSVSVVAETGEDIFLDLGVASLFIDGGNVGPGVGQIPPGARVSLAIDDEPPQERKLYSPAVRVSVRDDAGNPVTGLSLFPAAALEVSFDFTAVTAKGLESADLAFLRITDAAIFELPYAPGDPETDAEFGIPIVGRARAELSNPGRHAVAEAIGSDPDPTPVALTGTAGPLTEFSTMFQLVDAIPAYGVTLVLPTADTDDVPNAITLNESAFNSGNPSDPDNRLLTVLFGGNLYTTNHPSASVALTLNTFGPEESTGALTGVLGRQAGVETLAINFTFTAAIDEETPPALGGTAAEGAGRRSLSLARADGSEQVVLVMPESLPNVGLEPIIFNSGTFDDQAPFDPGNLIFTLSAGGQIYSSAISTAEVTLTFETWDDETLDGAGTITGTVFNEALESLTLDYVFVVAGGAFGGDAELAAAEPLEVTTETAAATAVIHDGFAYVAVWLGEVGVENRVIRLVEIDDETFDVGPTPQSFEPTAALAPEGGFGAASSDGFADMVIVGATGDDPESDEAVAIFWDFAAGGSLEAEIVLGAGAAPRVVFHAGEDCYVIAWQAGADVHARTFEYDGTEIGSVQTVFTAATLAGLAPAGGASMQVLVAAVPDAGGVSGRYLNASTGDLGGSAFALTGALGGGLCAWDPAGERFLVVVETLLAGIFPAQQVVALDAGDTELTGDALPLLAGTSFTRAAGGSSGVIFATPNGSLYAVESAGGSPLLADFPLFGAMAGLDLDITPGGAAIVSDGGTGFLMLAARGEDGASAIPVTLTSDE